MLILEYRKKLFQIMKLFNLICYPKNLKNIDLFSLRGASPPEPSRIIRPTPLGPPELSPWTPFRSRTILFKFTEISMHLSWKIVSDKRVDKDFTRVECFEQVPPLDYDSCTKHPNGAKSLFPHLYHNILFHLYCNKNMKSGSWEPLYQFFKHSHFFQCFDIVEY